MSNPEKEPDEEMFEKIDKIIEEYYGTQCSDYEPSCPLCKVWDHYNEFKMKIKD